MNKSDIFGGVAGLALVGIFAGWAYNIPTSHVTTMQDMVDASVQIGKYCSGTVINDPDLSDGEQMTVITAKHCLDANQGVGSILEVNVPKIIGNEYIGDTTIKVIVKDVSEKSDLIRLEAIKKGEGLDIPKVDVYKGIPKFGDDVIAMGYPLGLNKTMTKGVLGYTESLMWVFKTTCVFPSESCLYQKATPGIAPGSSGGGLFEETDSGYQLVGVLTGADMRVTFSDFYTPVNEIREFLDGEGS